MQVVSGLVRSAGKSVGALAAALPQERRNETIVMLDGWVEEWAPRTGRTMACVAFGVNERSNRHRRQAPDGRARLRPPV